MPRNEAGFVSPSDIFPGIKAVSTHAGFGHSCTERLLSHFAFAEKGSLSGAEGIAAGGHVCPLLTWAQWESEMRFAFCHCRCPHSTIALLSSSQTPLLFSPIFSFTITGTNRVSIFFRAVILPGDLVLGSFSGQIPLTRPWVGCDRQPCVVAALDGGYHWTVRAEQRCC